MTQQNTMPELKPCPMCGGKATLSKWESPVGVHEEVRCFKCGTSNPIVKFWNTRTPDHTDLLKHARHYLDGVARIENGKIYISVSHFGLIEIGDVIEF